MNLIDKVKKLEKNVEILNQELKNVNKKIEIDELKVFKQIKKTEKLSNKKLRESILMLMKKFNSVEKVLFLSILNSNPLLVVCALVIIKPGILAPDSRINIGSVPEFDVLGLIMCNITSGLSVPIPTLPVKLLTTNILG